MKKLLLIAAAAIVAFAACQKDPEDTGKQEAKAPVLTKIQPSSGYAGDVATITGENFSATAADNKVVVGTAEAEVKEATATTLKIVLPENPEGAAKITVTVGGKSSKEDISFTYLKRVLPMTVSGIDPTEAKIGDEVVISGENFGTDPSAVTVLFGEAVAEIKTITETAITVIVPEGNGDVAVLVLKGDETSDPQMFTYVFDREVVVSAVSPVMVTKGDEITVEGTGFTDDVADVTVLVGETEATVTVSGEDGIKFDVPAGLESLKDYEITIKVAGAAPVTAGLVRFYQFAKYRVDCVVGNFTSGTSKIEEGIGLLANIPIPEGIVINPEGTELWITSRGGSGATGQHGVHKVSLSNYEMHIVVDQKTIGNDKFPWGGDFNSKGDYYVALKGKNLIGRYVNSTWSEFSIFNADNTATAIKSPMNVIFDDSDNMYIASRDTKSIIKIYVTEDKINEGKIVGFDKEYDLNGIQPYTIAFNPDKTKIVVGTNGGKKILVMDLASGDITTVAGNGTANPTTETFVDGAPLETPIGNVTGLYWDKDGCIYFNDWHSYTVRVLIPGVGNDYTKGIIKTLAGIPMQSGLADGAGAEAKFGQLGQLVKDPKTGNIYVADGNKHRIRKISVVAE